MKMKTRYFLISAQVFKYPKLTFDILLKTNNGKMFSLVDVIEEVNKVTPEACDNPENIFIVNSVELTKEFYEEYNNTACSTQEWFGQLVKEDTDKHAPSLAIELFSYSDDYLTKAQCPACHNLEEDGGNEILDECQVCGYDDMEVLSTYNSVRTCLFCEKSFDEWESAYKPTNRKYSGSRVCEICANALK